MIIHSGLFSKRWSTVPCWLAYHSCSNHLNLEMEAECLTKTLPYLILNIFRTKYGRNKLQKLLAIFNIDHIFTPFVDVSGCRFLYFFSLCDVRNEAVFLLLEHSSLREVKQKKQVKNVKFWPLNPYYKRSDWKT